MRLTNLALRNEKYPDLSQSTGTTALLEALGYIRSLGAGHLGILPLGQKVLENIRSLIRARMADLGAQEISLPIAAPSSLWLGQNELWFMGERPLRFMGDDGGEYLVSPPHEAPFMEFLKPLITSSQDLPLVLFSESPRFQNNSPEEASRENREFLRLEGLTLQQSFTQLNGFFPKLVSTFKSIFSDCGVPALTAEAGCGPWGGQKAYSFSLPTFSGETMVIACSECGYTARQDAARGEKESFPGLPKAMEKQAWQNGHWVEGAQLLGYGPPKQVKIRQFDSSRGLVTAVWRSDYHLSPEKLAAAAGVPYLQVSQNTTPPGFEDLREPGLLVVDDGVSDGVNLAFPSREPGTFYTNVNFGRDFESPIQRDIVIIGSRDACPYCHAALTEVKARELGMVIKGSQALTQRSRLSVVDKRYGSLYPWVGSFKLQLGRLFEAAAENSRDSRGLRWSPKIAPFMGYLVIADTLKHLEIDMAPWADKWGDLILWDDRTLPPQDKISMGDVLGIPLRITVNRSLWERKKVELRCRQTGTHWQVPLNLVKGELERCRLTNDCRPS